MTYVLTAHARGFPAWLGRPQDLREGLVDFRFAEQPPYDVLLETKETTPIVFAIEAFGAQGGIGGAATIYGESNGWRHTQKPGAGKFLGGTANGGYVIMPPEYDLFDLGATGFSNPSVASTSEVVVIAAPGTNWGVGLPDKIEGKLHRGWRWGADPASPLESRFERATDRSAGAISHIDQLRFRDSETVHNEGGADIDWRAESDINAYGLYLNAEKGIVGVGVNTSYGSYPGWGPTSIEDGSVDVAANQRIGGALTLDKELVTRAVTPSTITSNLNNYDPGRGTVNRLATDASRTVTGFVKPFSAPVAGGYDSIHKLVVNVGSFDLVLAHQSASSIAANRIITDASADLTIGAGKAAFLLYDATTERWRVLWRSPETAIPATLKVYMSDSFI